MYLCTLKNYVYNIFLLAFYFHVWVLKASLDLVFVLYENFLKLPQDVLLLLLLP